MTKKCCFAGHGKIFYTESTYAKLLDIARKLIVEENVTEFFVGNYGNFDLLCTKAVQHLKKTYPHLQLTLVIPYITADINKHPQIYNKNFDGILLADIPSGTPKRFYILKCNEFTVRLSDFMICYVKNDFGGAYKTLSFAEKKQIDIFNLAQE